MKRNKVSNEPSVSTTDKQEKEIVLDNRHPLYIGFWKRSVIGVDTDIAKDDKDEPHVKRRLTIISKHPEIKELYGIEPWTIPITTALAFTQLALAYYFGTTEASWPLFLATAYIIGGSITQIYGVIIHEATHCLCSEYPFVNRMVGFLANVCIPFPIAASFRRYHLDHHAFQGVEGKDPDLPLKWEIYFVRGNMGMKILFLFFYPLMYVARGLALKKVPSTWEIINVIFTIITDTLIWNICGPKGLFYLFCSLWFGYGIHPAAMHFIQEHFSFADGQETYSYYGNLNPIFLNIGFHNEHHDFAKVPWSNLPEVKKAAPEFYEPLHSHNSWFKVLYDFITNPQLGPQSRVGRSYENHKIGRQMVVDAKKAMNRVDSGI